MSVRIGNRIFDAEYLENQEDIMKGMMGREKLEGCLVFKLEKGTHSFWMKNCLIPLDIVFVLNNKITTIHKNCPPVHINKLSPPKYTGIADHVIEFPSGTSNNWKVGDKVFINI